MQNNPISQYNSTINSTENNKRSDVLKQKPEYNLRF